MNLNNEFGKFDNELISEFINFLDTTSNWCIDNLKKEIDNFILIKKIKFSALGIPIRNILINHLKVQGLHEILYILGKKLHRKNKNYINKI